jgi:hypothetical protein
MVYKILSSSSLDAEHPGGPVVQKGLESACGGSPNPAFQGCLNLKAMIKNLLDEGKASGDIRRHVDTEALAEMIFSCTPGASVSYSAQKSDEKLDQTINALIGFIDSLGWGSSRL